MFERQSDSTAGGSAAASDVDVAPGKQPQAAVTADAGIHASRAEKVDRALETLGAGELHPSGATLHTDAVAADAAAAIGANAFTAGQDVFFGAGHYQPGTSEGDRIIQHELAHVAQAKGVAPPTPGNFTIASTSSREEVAARGASDIGHAPVHVDSGGAAPATIFRDVDTTGTAMQNLMTPWLGAEGAADFGATIGTAANIGESGKDKDKDALQAFRYAVLGGNVADIEAKWKNLKAAEKRQLREETDTILRMLQVWGPDAMKALPAIGVSVGADPRFSQHIMWQSNVPDWKAKMTANQWSQFIHAGPKKEQLDDKSRQGLAQAVKIAGGDGNAKHIFEKAFPTLQHDPKLAETDTTNVKVKQWNSERIARLFELLAQGMMPINHILAATGGFLLVTQQRTRNHNTDPWGSWESMDFAWWQPWNSVIVFPESSTGATQGGVGHGMVGGQGAQSAAPVGPSTHLQTSALHEIGHAVGDNIRGHIWASSGAAPPKWTKPPDTEIKAMWNSSDNVEPGGTAKKLPEADAKNVLYEWATTRNKTPPAGWTAADLDYALDTQYFKQPLYNLARSAQLGDNAYWRPVKHAGHYYAYLTRWDFAIGKYTEDAYNSKVSWYSLSSPNEWFAEQYVQYHITRGAGTGMDATTLAYMKDLDKATMAAPGSDPAVPATPGARTRTSGGESDRAASSDGVPGPRRHQFPWAW
jgi:hypothetical protein